MWWHNDTKSKICWFIIIILYLFTEQSLPKHYYNLRCRYISHTTVDFTLCCLSNRLAYAQLLYTYLQCNYHTGLQSGPIKLTMSIRTIQEKNKAYIEFINIYV